MALSQEIISQLKELHGQYQKRPTDRTSVVQALYPGSFLGDSGDENSKPILYVRGPDGYTTIDKVRDPEGPALETQADQIIEQLQSPEGFLGANIRNGLGDVIGGNSAGFIPLSRFSGPIDVGDNINSANVTRWAGLSPAERAKWLYPDGTLITADDPNNPFHIDLLKQGSQFNNLGLRQNIRDTFLDKIGPFIPLAITGAGLLAGSGLLGGAAAGSSVGAEAGAGLSTALDAEIGAGFGGAAEAAGAGGGLGAGAGSIIPDSYWTATAGLGGATTDIGSGALAALSGAADPIQAIATLDAIGGGAGASAGATALGYPSVNAALAAINPAWVSTGSLLSNLTNIPTTPFTKGGGGSGAGGSGNSISTDFSLIPAGANVGIGGIGTGGLTIPAAATSGVLSIPDFFRNISTIGPIVSGLSGLANAFTSARAGQQAADAANRATEAQLSIFNTINAQAAPYRGAGYTALSSLLGGTGLGPGVGDVRPGQFTHVFDANDLKTNLAPNYQFQLEQGLGQVRNAANASGGLMSGNTLKNISDYTINKAGDAYQQAFQNYNANQTNIFNRLSSIAGFGQTANQTLAGAGSSISPGVSQSITNVGQARAAGTVGAGNALTSAANNAFGWYALPDILNYGRSGIYTGSANA